MKSPSIPTLTSEWYRSTAPNCTITMQGNEPRHYYTLPAL